MTRPSFASFHLAKLSFLNTGYHNSIPLHFSSVQDNKTTAGAIVPFAPETCHGASLHSREKTSASTDKSGADVCFVGYYKNQELENFRISNLLRMRIIENLRPLFNQFLEITLFDWSGNVGNRQLEVLRFPEEFVSCPLSRCESAPCCCARRESAHCIDGGESASHPSAWLSVRHVAG